MADFMTPKSRLIQALMRKLKTALDKSDTCVINDVLAQLDVLTLAEGTKVTVEKYDEFNVIVVYVHTLKKRTMPLALQFGCDIMYEYDALSGMKKCVKHRYANLENMMQEI